MSDVEDEEFQAFKDGNIQGFEKSPDNASNLLITPPSESKSTPAAATSNNPQELAEQTDPASPSKKRPASEISDADQAAANPDGSASPRPPKIAKTSTGSPQEEKEEEKGGMGMEMEEEEDEPEMTFVTPQKVVEDREYDDDFYVKTLAVKDFGNAIMGCTMNPGVEYVSMMFDPKGMQLYAKAASSPSVATTFFNKEMFEVYNVKKKFCRVLMKSRLESLKKRINKEVEFLEITNSEDGNGFKFSGHKVYKIGGKCAFSVNITDNAHDTQVVDMSSIEYQWHLKTSSQKFKDNVEFIDDSNEYVQMVVKGNSIEFKGIRDTGDIGESIDQETESKISQDINFKSLFYKKYLKVITAVKDLNRTLNISFNLDDPDALVYPVHFSYELDKENPQSHFSAYLLPFTMQS